MSKILILGGTGNISTPITRELLARGEEVLIMHKGADPQLPGLTNVRGDCDSLADKQRAAQSGPFDCVIDMLGYTRQNAEDDVAAFAGKTRQFIFCSTINVFSAPAPTYPVTNATPRYPDARFGYAFEKAEMERIYENAAAQGAFVLTIIRPSCTYNETSLPISMVNDGDAGHVLVTRLKEGKPILVPGDGNGLWCYTYREDCALAFIGAAGNSKAYGKAYNLTGDECFTWEESYRVMARAWDAPEPTFVRMASDLAVAALPAACDWMYYNFSQHVLYDSTEAKQDLGYRYRTTWFEGCQMQRAWQEAHGGPKLAYSRAYDTLLDRYSLAKEKMVAEIRQMRLE